MTIIEVDLSPPTFALRMRRNDVQSQGFTVSESWLDDLDAWLCQVKRDPNDADVAVEWDISIDPDNSRRVIVTYDVTGLEGLYVADVQDDAGRTRWAYTLRVDADVTRVES